MCVRTRGAPYQCRDTLKGGRKGVLRVCVGGGGEEEGREGVLRVCVRTRGAPYQCRDTLKGGREGVESVSVSECVCLKGVLGEEDNIREEGNTIDDGNNQGFRRTGYRTEQYTYPPHPCSC